jgi:hypothetical protein
MISLSRGLDKNSQVVIAGFGIPLFAGTTWPDAAILSNHTLSWNTFTNNNLKGVHIRCPRHIGERSEYVVC